jgi:hypothetical protein
MFKLNINTCDVYERLRNGMTLPKLKFRMSTYLKNNIVDELRKYSKLLIPWFHI